MSGKKQPLVDLKIKNMKNGSRLTDTNENRGLIVKKSPKTKKTSFFYRYEELGTKKSREIKFGDYPDMSLSKARVELQKLKQIRRNGGSPADEIKQQKNVVKKCQSKSETFKDLIDLYLIKYIEVRKGKSDNIINDSKISKYQKEVRRTLYSDPIKKLGKYKATDITKKQIISLIMDVINRNAKTQAKFMLNLLVSVFDYAIGLDVLDESITNPALLAKKTLLKSKIKFTNPSKIRHFSILELKKFLQWLPECPLPKDIKNIFLLTLYTGCRTGEWCNAKWEHIDLSNKTFLIPIAKNNTSHAVQLSKQACELLQEIKKDNTLEYIFPKRGNNQNSLSKKLSYLKQKNRMLDIEDWTPHDLRRTVRTGLAQLNCPTEVAEAVLGHSPKGIVGTYNLYSYADQCREWLQRWCDHIDNLRVTSYDISDII